MICECGGKLVKLKSGQVVCSKTLARFLALYGYKPEVA